MDETSKKIMACGCGSKKRAGETMATSENQIEIWYMSKNTGRHHVVFNGNQYDRHCGGGAERFNINTEDYEIDQKAPEHRRLFKAVKQIVVDPIPQPQEMAAPDALSPPGVLAEISADLFPLHLLSMNVQTLIMTIDLGKGTKQEIRDFGYEKLLEISGIGPATAQRIMELAE